MKSTTELLKPRYKVIADYPHAIFTVNQLIELIYKHGKWIFEYDTGIGFSHHTKTDMFDKFPHLFKKLEWWEDRNVKDMPKYIKSKRAYHVVEAKSWRLNKVKPNYTWAEIEASNPWFVEDCEPATLTDYEIFTKKDKL